MSSDLPMVAIVGRPNVGKSSLFNRLSKQQQAIVASEPGTTRDAIQRLVAIDNKRCWLVDTAGLAGRMASDEPDINLAVSGQVLEAINNADVVLAVFDSLSQLTAEDRQILKRLHKAKKPILAVVNKIDKTKQTIPAEFSKLGKLPIVGVSTTIGIGLADLTSQLSQLLPATSKATVPATAGLAIVGRPNVGKSSLFNQLAGREQAIVSPRAHTTRDANLIQLKLGSKLYNLFDTAGIRKPGKRQYIEAFSYLRTMRAINSADVSILVIDAMEPSVKLDQAIAGLAKDALKGLVLVINKWDLVKDKADYRLLIEHKLQTDFAFVWWAPVIYMSAANGTNLDKLKTIIQDIILARQQTYNPAQLNQIISQATAHHRPPSHRRGRPMISSITQTGSNPPEFTVSGRYLGGLHWSYRRYLESQLREHLNLTGTAINLKFGPTKS